jgi:hypothetical protein
MRICGLLKVPNTASLHKHGCHVMTCMTEGVELGRKGLWHGMGALGALPWQGTRFFNTWGTLWAQATISCMHDDS